MTGKTKKIETMDEGRQLASEFVAKNVGGMAWCVITDKDGVLEFHERTNQPCYGEMRPYGRTHKDLLPVHQRGVNKPGDLHDPFPDGTPVLIAVPFFASMTSDEDHNRILNMVLDPGLSPWRGVLLDFDTVKSGNRIIGIVIKNTEIDPTLMVNMFMTLRYMASYEPQVINRLNAFPDVDPYVILSSIIFVGKGYSSNPNQPKLSVQTSWGYVIAPDLDFASFFAGRADPAISDGGTFRLRYAYNRPDLHNVFGRTGKTFVKTARAVLGDKIDSQGLLDEATLPEVFKLIEDLRDGKVTAAA